MNYSPILTPVRKAHQFDRAALTTYLSKKVPGSFQGMKIQQFEGGQSNPTFLLSLADRMLVLRKKPPGKLLHSAHMVEREFRIMSALANCGVPVPKTYLLCEDEAVIGTPFFVMEYVEGRVLSDPRLMEFSASERKQLYQHAMIVLSALHDVDYRSQNLDDYGRPGNYYLRQISRWSKQYRASKTEEISSIEKLMEWLPSHVPSSDETTLVHGDFRLGNCIIHPTEARIVAVLDWELSTLGHPLADLAYFAMPYHHMPGSSWKLPNQSGIPSEAQLLADYARLSGRDPGESWTFYLVFQLFRMAAIFQGVVKRGLEGNASSDRWSELRDECKLNADTAWSLVERAR